MIKILTVDSKNNKATKMPGLEDERARKTKEKNLAVSSGNEGWAWKKSGCWGCGTVEPLAVQGKRGKVCCQVKKNGEIFLGAQGN